MRLSGAFDPAIVRRVIELAGDLHVAEADDELLKTRRHAFAVYVQDLGTRPVQMLLGVMAVGQGESPDLEDTMETVAARFEPKPLMAQRMIENTSLADDLQRGLASLLIDPLQA